jgi:TonB family protein
MRNIFYFFLESNVYLMAFLLVFILLFNNENSFRFNRFYLLLSILLSLTFPLIPFNTLGTPGLGIVVTGSQNFWLPEIIVYAGKESIDYIDWFVSTEIWSMLTIIYLLGLSVCLILFFFQLYRLFRLFLKTETYKWENCHIMESEQSDKIFSFFNFIFIGKKVHLTDQEKMKIIEHEEIHATHLHTLDIILSDLLINFFWFNPLIRIYKKKLIQQHEFEADSRAVENSGVNDYCNLLARVALSSAGFPLANHFNNSLTIKRITMMQTVKKKMNNWKIAGLILIVPAIIFIISCKKDSANETPESQQSQTSSLSEGPIFTVVEKMAEFPGGQAKLGEFLGKNLKYPEVASKNGVEGVVYTSFIVGTDGAIQEPTIVKGISKECDEEALRVISMSPKWIPGEQNGKKVKLRMSLPIRFALTVKETSTPSPDQSNSIKTPTAIATKQLRVNGKNRIEGTILDENQKPISGVIIIQRGTTTGTLTNRDGIFSIEPVSAVGELVISHVNYSSNIPFDFTKD